MGTLERGLNRYFPISACWQTIYLQSTFFNPTTYEQVELPRNFIVVFREDEEWQYATGGLAESWTN